MFDISPSGLRQSHISISKRYTIFFPSFIFVFGTISVSMNRKVMRIYGVCVKLHVIECVLHTFVCAQ